MPDNQLSANQSAHDSAELTTTPMSPQIEESSTLPRRLRLKRWLNRHQKLAGLSFLVIIIILLAAIPFSRYHLAALVLKKNYSIRVLDATTNLPVSGVNVQVGTQTTKTDANGRAQLRLPVGTRLVEISKNYYRARAVNELVPVLNQKNVPDLLLQATGRQVELNITNLINKKNLSNVDIETAGISARTNQNGDALLVLPAGVAHQQASLTLDGYNQASVTINVSDKKIEQNNFTMTPVGKVYFLSQQAGKLDVMKSNLDGSDAQVVVAGTGNEDVGSTSLFHSADWRYLALLAKRSSDPAELYVISTADDQLLTMDQGNESFTPVGWDGDNFIYMADRQAAIDGVYDQVTLKSYNAQTGGLSVIDKTDAQSINADTFIKSTIGNVNLLNGHVIYTKFWDRFGYYAPTTVLTGKTDGIYRALADGTANQTVETFSATDWQWVDANQRNPNNIYYQLNGFDSSGNRKNSVYYDYSNGQLSLDKNITANEFDITYPNYFLSADGSQYFWGQANNGSTDFFVSSQLNGSQQKITSLRDYSAAGWFGPNYLLLSKGGDELFVMSAGGGTPVKISDYQPSAVY